MFVGAAFSRPDVTSAEKMCLFLHVIYDFFYRFISWFDVREAASLPYELAVSNMFLLVFLFIINMPMYGRKIPAKPNAITQMKDWFISI